MIAESKFLIPPVLASLYAVVAFLEQLPDGISLVLDLSAASVLVGSILVYGRLKARSEASEGAAAAWQSERDAAVARAERLQTELDQDRQAMADMRVAMAELEARPTLDKLEEEIKKLQSLIQTNAAAMEPMVAPAAAPSRKDKR